MKLSFHSKLDWSFQVVSIAKNASWKIETLMFYKFLSSEVALYLYKSFMQSRMN